MRVRRPTEEGFVKDLIDSRFTSLIAEGDTLVRRIPRGEHGLDYWVRSDTVPEYHAWLASVANLIDVVSPHTGTYRSQVQKILAHENMPNGIPSTVVQQMHGVLKGANADWNAGTLRRIEFVVAAATFDDFLDHAALYHKGGKKIEASVLASAVLEDAVKKVAGKAGISTSGESLEQLIDALVAGEIFTSVKAKRIKSWAGVRNLALHAEWESFDIKDVGMMIDGIRELLDTHL
jgi:hypothetical protein